MGASIKGLLLEPVVRRLRGLRDAGKLDDDDVEEWLEPQDLGLVRDGAQATFWYPIACHDRMLRLLCAVESGGDPRWYAEFGRMEAEGVLSSGPLRILAQGARAFGSRAGVALVKMGDLAFDFGRWEFRGDALDDFEVEGQDVAALPESLRLTLEGFIVEVAALVAGVRVRVTSERAAPDRVRYVGRPA